MTVHCHICLFRDGVVPMEVDHLETIGDMTTVRVETIYYCTRCWQDYRAASAFDRMGIVE